MRWIEYIESLGFHRMCYSVICNWKDCNSCDAENYTDDYMLIIGEWVIINNLWENSLKITDIGFEKEYNIEDLDETEPTEAKIIEICTNLKKYMY